MTKGFTKWCEAEPSKDSTSKVAALFLMKIIHRFGIPVVVITDNGTHFQDEFHDLCIQMNINHCFATPYHP